MRRPPYAARACVFYASLREYKGDGGGGSIGRRVDCTMKLFAVCRI